MNNKIKIMLSVFGIILISLICKAQQIGTLKIQVTNLETSEGLATVNLFREQDDIPKKPFKTLSASIQNGMASISFNDVPKGDYALIAYHDKNANGTLDHKMGFPDEPMGFSNNWNLSLFSGMPTFKKLRFKFDNNNVVIKIEVD